MWNRKTFAAILAAFLLLINGKAQAVFAHAELIYSIPEENAVLESPPPQIDLFFSETVTPEFSNIQVFDSSGAEVQIGNARRDPAFSNHLFIPIRSLPAGNYTVQWRSVSAANGHMLEGQFRFSVGEVTMTAVPTVPSDTSSAPFSLSTAVQWLVTLTAMLLTGGFFFLWQVWRPAGETTTGQLNQKLPWHSMALGTLLILTSANLIWLLVQAGMVTGRIMAAPWDEAVRRVLFLTRFGPLWAARFVLILLLLGLIYQPPTKYIHLMRTALSLALLLTLSLGGHGAAQANPILPILGDFIHIGAASIWFGGTIYLVTSLALLRSPSSARKTIAPITSILLKRFSHFALVSLVILSLSGGYAAVLRLNTWSDLGLTDYGRTLSLKFLLFFVLVGIGAYSQSKLVPQVTRSTRWPGRRRSLRQLHSLLRLKSLLGAAVLLAAALLTASPTPNSSAVVPMLQQTAKPSEIDANIAVVPGRVGINDFTVTINKNGEPLPVGTEVALNFESQFTGLSIDKIALRSKGDSSFATIGGYLSAPDFWQLEAIIMQEERPETMVQFSLDLQEATAVSAAFPWFRATGGLLVAAGLAYWFGLTPILRQRVHALLFVYSPAVFLVFLGTLAVLSSPPSSTATNGPTFALNPLAPDADSIAIGQILYGENCAMCHGQNGAGNGPVGITLNPPPADLRVHAASGAHPDGELFLWISEGVAFNPAMPAFGEKLDVEERWHLVNYIRTLAN